MPENKDPSLDLNELIAASAVETEDSVTVGQRQSAPLFNHPLPVIASWTLLIIVILTLTLTPLPREDELGIRSVETRVSVAMYHAAHRVETYRKFTGHLPDYLEPEWFEAETIQYERLDSGYRITGKEAALTLTYNEGDDSERLLHYTFLKLGAQR